MGGEGGVLGVDDGLAACDPIPSVMGADTLPESTLPDSLLVNLRLARTLDSAGIGIVEIDAEGRLIRVNAGLCEQIGCGETELLGQSIFDRSHPADREADRALYRRQVAGEFDR